MVWLLSELCCFLFLIHIWYIIIHCKNYLHSTCLRFYHKLTFRIHVNELTNKAESKLKLLKRLTGTKLGISKGTLLLTYNMCSVLTYGQELLIIASNSVNHELEIIQNKTLRIICGGVKFTPITAMEMFTDVKTIRFSREEAALKIYQRIIRTPNSLWNNFTATEQQCLKSNYSFVNKIKLLHQKYE